MRRTSIVALLVLVTVSVASFAEDPRLLTVPSGTIPTLDGTLSEGEWDDAYVLLVDDSVTAYLKHRDGSLYMGVRGQPYGVGSPCIVRADEIQVLHSSVALGTAVYIANEGSWTLSQSFTWECSYSSLTTTAQRCLSTYFGENGWRATNGRMGEPTDFEYEILIDAPQMTMLFLFLNVEPEMRVVSWPTEVADSPAYMEIARGYLPAEMPFRAPEWLTLHMDSEE